MKLESWSIAQRSTMIHGQTTTDITLATHDELANNKSFIEYIQAYDPECTDSKFDMDEYHQLKAEKAEREKLQDSFRMYHPEQIVNECDRLWSQLTTVLESNFNTPEYKFKSKLLYYGIELLRAFGYWWTPKGVTLVDMRPTVVPDEMVKKEE